jgi:hypothetical protein
MPIETGFQDGVEDVRLEMLIFFIVIADQETLRLHANHFSPQKNP